MTDDTDDLLDVPGIGPALAEECRELGFETAADIYDADVEELQQITGVGPTKARNMLAGKSAPKGQGAPEKFDDVRDDLLDAAENELNLKQVAHAGGIAKSTLWRYLDEREEFAQEFRKARAAAASNLVDRAMDPSDDVDTRFAQFLLERSFKFIKTEKHEVEADNTHRIEGDGFVVEFGE